jgi:hypothetical protein
MSRRIFAALWALSAFSGAARAADYFVSASSGSDSNPGTLAAPFLTIRKGLESAGSPGDAVQVRAGTYETGERLFMRRSGEKGRPITLSNYPGEAPVIRFLEANGGRFPRIEIQNPDDGSAAIGWLVIKGLEIAGGYEGIKFYNAHDLTIEGNDIHDSLWQGILGVGGLRVSIVKNKLRRNGAPAAAPGDRTLANKLHGIYASGTEYAVLDNEFDSNFAWGIQAAGYPYDKAAHAGPEYAGASRWRIAGYITAASWSGRRARRTS